MKTVGESFVSMLLGAAGGLLVALIFRWDRVSLGEPLAALIAVVGAAALGRWFGLGEHIRRQERDEMSRRFVDEGFDRLAASFAEHSARVTENLKIIEYAVIHAQSGDVEKLSQRLATLTAQYPEAGHEAYRLGAVFREHALLPAISVAYADLRKAYIFATRQASHLLSLIAEGKKVGLSDEKVQESLRYVEVLSAAHLKKLAALRDPLLVALSKLSVEFQASRVASVQELLDLESRDGRLKAVLRDLDKMLKEHRKKRDAISTKAADVNTATPPK